jgi:hypothetical protein
MQKFRDSEFCSSESSLSPSRAPSGRKRSKIQRIDVSIMSEASVGCGSMRWRLLWRS